MPVKRCLFGGVVVSGLIFASFLVYVDNFTPYFQQTNRFYTTRRFTQNSTTSRHLISQPPRSPKPMQEDNHNIGLSSTEISRTSSNQTGAEVKIAINNNVTTVSPGMIKEILAQNRFQNQSKVDSTTNSLTNSTKPVRTNSSDVQVQRTTISSKKTNKMLDNNQQIVTAKSGHNLTSPPTVLQEMRRFDRPNPDLSGYVSVPDLKTPLDIHCNTCAIVSSSGQMLGTKAGVEIDSATCVIRMNDAPIKKFERDVGSRTTVRVLGHSASGPVKNKQRSLLLGTGEPEHMIMWGPARSMKTDGKGYGYNTMKQFKQLYKKTKFYILTQKQMDFSDKSFELETGKNRMTSGSWLTTGWFTIQLARNICDEIHMYGMISDDYCKHPENAKKNTKYHYYNNSGGTECSYYTQMEGQHKSAHRFITEKSIYAEWAKQEPRIFFHHPAWEPPKKSSYQIKW